MRKLSDFEYFLSSSVKDLCSPFKSKAEIGAVAVAPTVEDNRPNRIRSKIRGARACANIEEQLEVVDIEQML